MVIKNESKKIIRAPDGGPMVVIGLISIALYLGSAFYTIYKVKSIFIFSNRKGLGRII